MIKNSTIGACFHWSFNVLQKTEPQKENASGEGGESNAKKKKKKEVSMENEFSG